MAQRYVFQRDRRGRVNLDASMVEEAAAAVRADKGLGTPIDAAVADACNRAITRFAKEYVDAHPTVSFDRAVIAVADRHPDLLLLAQCPRVPARDAYVLAEAS